MKKPLQSSIKTLEEIGASAEVKKALSGLTGLSKPKFDLKEKLDHVALLYRVPTPRLEKFMAIFSGWQNYLAEQSIIADTIRTVADSQAQYYYSQAIRDSEGTISERRELASSDPYYLKASKVSELATAYYNSLKTQFENCDRAYKLASRILTSRLGLKEIT